MGVAMIVIMPIAVTVVVRVATAVSAIAVVFVLAIVVAVIVPDLVVVFVSMELTFPTAVSAPVGMFASSGEWAAVSEMRVVVVVDVPTKADGATEPGARAEEHASSEPLRTIVAKGRTLIGRVTEVAIGADWCHSNADVDLRGRTFLRAGQTNESQNRHS
jgi:hypothetical protein